MKPSGEEKGTGVVSGKGFRPLSLALLKKTVIPAGRFRNGIR
jgi:hypothetical protein